MWCWKFATLLHVLLYFEESLWTAEEKKKELKWVEREKKFLWNDKGKKKSLKECNSRKESWVIKGFYECKKHKLSKTRLDFNATPSWHAIVKNFIHHCTWFDEITSNMHGMVFNNYVKRLVLNRHIFREICVWGLDSLSRIPFIYSQFTWNANVIALWGSI